MSSWDVIVVGGGIAGLQAAIYTAKAGEETLVLDAGDPWVRSTDDIQNLIGFNSVRGSSLVESGRHQVEAFGGEIVDATVERVTRTDTGLLVTADGDDYETNYVVIASAGSLDYLDPLDLEFTDGVEGQYYMERHVRTDAANRAAEGVYAAGLARTWEFQTAVAIGDGAKAATNLLSEKYREPYMDHDI